MKLWLGGLPVAGSALRALARGQREAKAALREVPVVGPALRRLWRARPRPAASGPAFRPERFLALYAERNGIDRLDAIDDPVKRLHATFAFSTVDRGRRAIERIAEHAPLRGRRCLDVGCAYGGFLVGYAEAGAREVVGIDVNPQLLDYARPLTADYAVRAELRHLDVLAADRAPELGRFGVLTCNDVIEHVLDPRRALAQLAGLLEDDGVLYMEIPNRHSARFVRSDGHFQRFGLTALPKPLADAYFRQASPGATNDVTYRSLPFYLHHLRRAGLEVELLDGVTGEVAGALARIGETFAECVALAARPIDGVDEATRRAVELRVRRLARAFDHEHARWRELRGRDARGAQRLGEKLVRAHGHDFWVLLARRRGGTDGERPLHRRLHARLERMARRR